MTTQNLLQWDVIYNSPVLDPHLFSPKKFFGPYGPQFGPNIGGGGGGGGGQAPQAPPLVLPLQSDQRKSPLGMGLDIVTDYD